MDKKVFIIGHRNPDTDSICSAISYAELKNKTGDGSSVYIPRRAGHLNEETQYVLDYFGIPAPQYMKEVSTQVRDIEIRDNQGITDEVSIKKAWDIMDRRNVVTLPIVEERALKGIITVGAVARSYMDVYDNRILSDAHTSYKNIVETLEGQLVAGDINGFFENGKVVVAAANPDVMENIIDASDMVILGNRYEAQLCAVEMQAGAIIVCDGSTVTKTIKRLAEQNGCRVIVTNYDAYTTARLINQSIPVKHFMMKAEDIVSFHIDDTLDDIKEIMTKNRFRDFPILDENDCYIGTISRRNVLSANKKQVILVDHNEKGQAPEGIEEAEISEIIDHHRLGTIETMTPVFFRNQPVGCTCTIIYQMYKERGIIPDKKTAGLMCAAILSDTLIFLSPTCTEIDKQSALELAAIAEINTEAFAEKMFKAGSNFGSKNIRDIIFRDFKRFTINDVNFGIGQVNTMSGEEIEELKPRVLEYMKSDVAGDEILFIMLTNIMSGSSEVVCSNAAAVHILSESFNIKMDGQSATLPGVVSRKKQLVPSIIEGLQQ